MPPLQKGEVEALSQGGASWTIDDQGNFAIIAPGSATVNGVPIATGPSVATDTYLTLSNESATLPNSRRLVGGTGVTLADGGAGSTLTVNLSGITLAQLANIAAATILGNNGGGPAAPVALTAAQAKGVLAITAGDVSGLAPIATSGSGADLVNSSVSLGKLANIAAGTVLANLTGGPTAPTAVTLAALATALDALSAPVLFNVDNQAGHYLYVETDNTAIPSEPGYTVWIQGLDGQFIGWGVGGEINVTALGPVNLVSGTGSGISIAGDDSVLVSVGAGGLIDLTTPNGGELTINDSGAVTILNASGNVLSISSGGNVALGVAGAEMGFFGEAPVAQATVNGASVLLTSVVTQFNLLLAALGDNGGLGLIDTNQ